MKKWMILLGLLVMLTACGKQEIPAQPYELEVEYGESGIAAEKGACSWSYEGGRVETEAVEPLGHLSEIPYLNLTKDKKINLLFDEKPDTLELAYWSSTDSYKTRTAVEKPKSSFAVPADGAAYLYEVTARWSGGENGELGGSCTYYFRFLPEGASGEQTQEMSLLRLVQLEPSELFGVEFINNLDGLQKTCTGTQDLTAILEYLKTHLSTNFVQIEMPEEEADYVLRLAVTQGAQLTLSYGGEGQGTWILLGGVPYEAEVMDLYSLWESLEAADVRLDGSVVLEYMQTSEEFPGEAWGEEFVYGYLRSVDGIAVYDQVNWIEDPEEPNGFRLEAGEAGLSLPLAEACEFWVLENHHAPYGQVSREDLWKWTESAGWDVLFRLYTKDGQITAICEQYVP